MNVTAWIMVAIAAIGCLLTSVTLVVKVTNLVSSIEPTITAKIAEAIKQVRLEFKEENDVIRHELGEALKPIREHISLYEEKHYKLELYIRDNYIEVDTFRNALDDIKALIKEVKDNVKTIAEADTSWRKEIRSKGN